MGVSNVSLACIVVRHGRSSMVTSRLRRGAIAIPRYDKKTPRRRTDTCSPSPVGVFFSSIPCHNIRPGSGGVWAGRRSTRRDTRRSSTSGNHGMPHGGGNHGIRSNPRHKGSGGNRMGRSSMPSLFHLACSPRSSCPEWPWQIGQWPTGR